MVMRRAVAVVSVLGVGFATMYCAHSRPPARLRADYPALVAALGPDSACAASVLSRVTTQSAAAPGYLPASPGGKVYFVRRLGTGEECRLPPGVQPLAYDVNGRLFCPDSTPATWTASDRLGAMWRGRTADVRMEEDSIALRRLRCPVAPLGLVRVRTTQPVPGSP
jgi:hypothetical protein